MTEDPKADLRRELKTLREEASARDPDAGETIASKFPMKLLDRYGPIVGGYLPINDEVDPLPLMKRLETGGAQLALPRLESRTEMTFRLWSSGDEMETGPFNLTQPLDGALEVHPTLLLVPLLAFDRLGTRLGYGKGHYDRTVAALREEGRVFACGLGFHVQMVDELPVEDHDQPLDWAVTERGSVPIFMMRTFAQDDGDDDGPGAA